MSELQVELVSADRLVWSGTASMVSARTVDGDIGVLPGHSPVLALLGTGEVIVHTAEEQLRAAVHGGFLSVADDRVSVLAESAELADEIDLDRARRLLAPTAGAMRVGHGFDVHRLVPGKRLMLGGVRVPATVGVVMPPAGQSSPWKIW